MDRRAFHFRYIMTNVPVHSSATIPAVGLMFSSSNTLSELYVYVLYPMSAVTFCGAIYMTLVCLVELSPRKNILPIFPFVSPTQCSSYCIAMDCSKLRGDMWLTCYSRSGFIRTYYVICTGASLLCDEMHYFKAVTVERYIAVCRPHHYR